MCNNTPHCLCIRCINDAVISANSATRFDARRRTRRPTRANRAAKRARAGRRRGARDARRETRARAREGGEFRRGIARVRAIEGDSRDPIGSRRTRGTSRDIARASVTHRKARASTRGREGRTRAVRGEEGGTARRRRASERRRDARDERETDADARFATVALGGGRDGDRARWRAIAGGRRRRRWTRRRTRRGRRDGGGCETRTCSSRERRRFGRR